MPGVTRTDAVLLMAYGSPDGLDEVEGYFTHIRGGRPPSDAAVQGLRERYRRVGGRTPLLALTRQVQSRLGEALGPPGRPAAVYVGMKHWHPFIADVVGSMRDDGITHVTALPLAPHYSRISIGGYRHALDTARAESGAAFDVTFVPSWHRHPAFLSLLTERVRIMLDVMSPSRRAATTVLFTAHSLPERIRGWGDPYEAEVAESAAAVAERAGIAHWLVSWQSAGSTGEPWIGPDLLERLTMLAHEGVDHVLIVPIGFVCDHLEILYDIDIEAVQHARALGMTLERIAMPNATPEFIRVLASVVADAHDLAAHVYPRG